MNGAIVPTVWDVPSAAAAKAAGAGTLFVGGLPVAASLGFPDIGVISVPELSERVAAIVDATGCEVIVDAETGYGPQPVLARLVRSLAEAGATAVMLEDQDYTGQSVASSPGLARIETMEERVRAAVAVSDRRLKVLARTDVLGADWPIEESIERLRRYLAAGADWVTPVFLRSRDELLRCGSELAGHLVLIAVRARSGYVPTCADAIAAGCVATVATAQHLVTFRRLVAIYRQSLDGDFRGLLDEAGDRAEFADAMGYARFGGWV